MGRGGNVAPRTDVRAGDFVVVWILRVVARDELYAGCMMYR